MKKGKSRKAASKRPVRTAVQRMGAKDKPPKMMNLSAALSAGDLAIGVKVFKPEELEPHGDPVEKSFHNIRVVSPLPGWLLVSSRHCVTGTVHRADGPAAGDGDTNFELCFPKTDPVTGDLHGQAKGINAKIDRQNAELTGAPGERAPLLHIEDSVPNQLPNGIIGIHCEVDPTDLETFKQDLAEMEEGQCYVICGHLVVDEGHNDLYEIHPVGSIEKC